MTLGIKESSAGGPAGTLTFEIKINAERGELYRAGKRNVFLDQIWYRRRYRCGPGRRAFGKAFADQSCLRIAAAAWRGGYDDARGSSRVVLRLCSDG